MQMGIPVFLLSNRGICPVTVLLHMHPPPAQLTGTGTAAQHAPSQAIVTRITRRKVAEFYYHGG